MATKRKRETDEEILSSPVSKMQKQDEVTRSGRVRKKPAKFEDTAEEAETKPDVAKLPRSPPVSRAQQAPVMAVSPATPAKIVVVPVKQEVQTPLNEDFSSTDEDAGRTPGRSSRARKKSAKVLEMEEFEEAEKKQVKKDGGKKTKSPPSTGPVVTETTQAPPANKPLPILKIKDIPTTPKVETVSPISIQISPQKSPVAGTSKSPVMSNISVKSPDNKASVIKLLLSSPTQTSKPALSTSSVAQTPHIPETKQSSKKSKAKVKGTVEHTSPSDDKSKIRQVLEMTPSVVVPTQSNISIIKQRLNAGPDPSIVKTESGETIVVDSTSEHEEIATVPVPVINKETKLKRGSKKAVDADESPFLPPPVPSPNVIHVGPMNIGLEVKQESEIKKKKSKVKSETDMGEEMIHEDFGLDMPEIELGEPGNDSFMEMEEDDGLMIPEEEVVTTEKTKTKKEPKKKMAKGKKKAGTLHLGDIPSTDGELVMDFARMKSDDKKKKKEKPSKEEPESASKKKRAPTAYMLWCSANRPRLVNDNPGIGFSSVSKTLGEMWSNLSEKDKMVWKRKAKKAAGKGSTLITTGKTGAPRIPGSQTVTTARQMAVASQKSEKSNPALAQALLAAKTVKQQPADDISTPVKGFGMDPLDVAAHLKIVGESLSIIGMKLQEHRGLIAVQGSLSVLLDSLLCTVAPLMCLTAVLPETNGLPSETHMKNLDNIAYIMPGL